MRSPPHSKSRIYRKQRLQACDQTYTVTDNLLCSIWASTKTVQAKDQETLPVFPNFQRNLGENANQSEEIGPSQDA